MRDGADTWPSLASDETLGLFQRKKDTPTTDFDVYVRRANELTDRDIQIEAILDHLETIDLDRHELREQTRSMSNRLLALEQALRQSVDANDEIYESLERRVHEAELYERRISPRLAELESGKFEAASEIAALNQDFLSAQLESESASSEFDGRIAEILDLLHEAKLVAAQARTIADGTADKTDQMIVELREVEETVESTLGLVEQVRGARKEMALQQQSLVGRFDDLSSEVKELAADVSSSKQLTSEVASISEELARFSQAAKSADGRAAEVDSRLSAGLAAAFSELVDVADRLDAVSKSTDDTNVRIGSLSNEVAATALEVGESKSAATDIARRLDTAWEKSRSSEEQLSSSIGSLSDDVVAQRAMIDAIDLRVDAVDPLVTEVDELAVDVHEALELVRGAQAVAEKAKDRADYSAKASDELRADFDGEVARSSAERKVANDANRIRLAAVLHKLKAQAHEQKFVAETVDPAPIEPDPQQVHADRYRHRWDEHMRRQLELRRQRWPEL